MFIVTISQSYILRMLNRIFMYTIYYTVCQRLAKPRWVFLSEISSKLHNQFNYETRTKSSRNLYGGNVVKSFTHHNGRYRLAEDTD